MAEPQTLDPFALMRDVVSQLEKVINERAGPLMKSDGFASVANNVMSGAMVAKKLAQDLTQRYFEALNLPSRSDIMALTDRLQAIEDRMIGIQATLDQLSGVKTRAALPSPSRTRKPPEPVVEAVARVATAPKRPRKSKP